MTPGWQRALFAGDVEALARELEAGRDVDARDRFGQTGLMVAAMRGDSETVAWLIAHGADLDHTAKFGLSALMLAVANGHQEVARRLVAADADLRLRGSGAPGFAGKTALDLAAERGDDALALLLRGHSDGGPQPDS
jgi:ankyrin repeat protein